MPTFNILVNHRKKWAVALKQKVASFLMANGYSTALQNADYTIVIGGDGTLYHYLDMLKGKVILIGSERSYRAQLTMKNWKGRILQLMKHKIISLPLFEIINNNKIIGRSMNDVVFHTNDHKVVAIEMQVGRTTSAFIGDGLILATPFGSTGYSFSAGGRNLALGSGLISITPICSYFRKMRPVVMAEADAKIKVRASKNTSLILDGTLKKKVCRGEYTIRVSNRNRIDFLAP